MRMRSDLQGVGELYFDVVRVGDDDAYNAVLNHGRLGPKQAAFGTASAEQIASILVGYWGADGEHVANVTRMLKGIGKGQHLTGQIAHNGKIVGASSWR